MKKHSVLIMIGLSLELAGPPLCVAQKEVSAPSISDSANISAAPSAPNIAPALALSDIKIEFKLDTRLTKSLYMGDRWVSPATFTQVGIEGANQVIIEAAAYLLDSKGRPLKTTPQWRTADPEVVTITRAAGNTVKLTVKRAGETSVEILSYGLSRKLSIKAVARGHDTIQADISPQTATRPKGVEAHANGSEVGRPISPNQG